MQFSREHMLIFSNGLRYTVVHTHQQTKPKAIYNSICTYRKFIHLNICLLAFSFISRGKIREREKSLSFRQCMRKLWSHSLPRQNHILTFSPSFAVFTPDLRCNVYPWEKHLGITAEVLLHTGNLGEHGLTAVCALSEYTCLGRALSCNERSKATT